MDYDYCMLTIIGFKICVVANRLSNANYRVTTDLVNMQNISQLITVMVSLEYIGTSRYSRILTNLCL